MKSHTIKQIESPVLRTDSNVRIQELHREAENLRFETAQLKKMISFLEQRNHEMLKNEMQYRNIIKSYQVEVKRKSNPIDTLSDTTERNASIFNETHKELRENIKKLQLKVDEILTSREETLVALYNSKLKEINQNLEKEKKKKYEELEGLAKTEHMLGKELQMLKGSVGVIEAKNTHLEKENKEIKQLLKVKDLEISELEKRMFEFKQQSIKFPSIKGAKSTDLHSKSQKDIKTISLAIETDIIEDQTSARYQKVISKLQKMLAIEKNNVRAARNAYFRELNSRSDIEEIILGCIEEVKKEKTNATKKPYQLSYNMSVVEKLTNNEDLLIKLQEFLTRKEEPKNE